MIKPNGFPYNTKQYSLILMSQALSVLVFFVILIPRLVSGTEERAFEAVTEHDPSVVLSLLPHTSTHEIGSVVPLQLYVNLANTTAVNAFGVSLNYPIEYLKVLEIDTDGSVCTLFPENSVNNEIGEVQLSCGLPSPGLSEPFGFLGTVQVKLLKEGYVNLSFGDSSQVLANDGLGTDLLSKTTSSGINIVSAKKVIIEAEVPGDQGEIQPEITVSPLAVSSPTHPQQHEWYNENTATFEWKNSTKEISSYSYVLDSNPDTTPGTLNISTDNSISLSNIGEGASYFHIMPIVGGVDTPVTHFQVKVDTNAPENLQVKSANSFGEDKYWTLEFEADDYNGIDRYEILHADGTTVEVNNPAQIILNDKFENTITIIAYDLGGNSTSIEYELQLTKGPTIWDRVAKFWDNITDYIRDF